MRKKYQFVVTRGNKNVNVSALYLGYSNSQQHRYSVTAECYENNKLVWDIKRTAYFHYMSTDNIRQFIYKNISAEITKVIRLKNKKPAEADNLETTKD